MCLCAVSTVLFYYYIYLSLVSPMSLPNIINHFPRDTDRDIICLPSRFLRPYVAQPSALCPQPSTWIPFGIPHSIQSERAVVKVRFVDLRLSRAFGTVARLKQRTGPVPTEPPFLLSDCLPVGPPSDRIRSDCRVAEQAPQTPVKRCLTPWPTVPRPSACFISTSFRRHRAGNSWSHGASHRFTGFYLGIPLSPKTS